MKEKIEDWYDSIVYNLRHIRENIQYFFIGLGRWFSYYKILRKIYDFDWDSIIEVEKYQITRVRNSISKYHNHVNWEHDVYWMNIALKLLNIVKENGCAERVGKDIDFKLREDGLYELTNDPTEYWIIPVYVNTKNYKRFLNRNFKSEQFEDSQYGNLFRDTLRVEKAWRIYNKLRTYYLRSWWD